MKNNFVFLGDSLTFGYGVTKKIVGLHYLKITLT